MRYLAVLVCLTILAPTVVQAQLADGRVYVRRIEFLGTDKINDDVLRRQMGQLEGTHINTVELERSRLRLESLPYVQSAQVAMRQVKGAPDQVDLLITITDAPARRYGGGGAYSDSHRFSLHGYFINANIFGTGQRFSAQGRVSEFHTTVELSHTNPYAHGDGISRTFALAWRDIDQLTADTSELEARLARARLEYSYQVAERQAIRLGLSLQDAELTVGPLASTQLVDWVSNNGNPTMQGNETSTDYLAGELLFGWHHDTRNKKVFPDRGLEQRFNVRVAVPGSEIEYYMVDYELKSYWPLGAGWTAKLNTKLGYGAKYGSDTTALAPNLNWFAGGPNSVRGYDENRLGPKDSLGNPYGGNLFFANQFELLMPLPKKWRQHTRIGFFYDAGNVFSTEGLTFLDDNGQDLDYGFDFAELRHSVGISATFRLPIGVLRLSYGVPLGDEADNPNRFLRDEIDRFQVSFGFDF